MNTPVVLLRAEPDIDAPLDRLTVLLADTVHTLFDETVAVLHMVEPDRIETVAPVQRRGGVLHFTLAASARSLRGALADCRAAGVDYAFLDSAKPAPWLDRFVTDLVELSRTGDQFTPAPGVAQRVLRTVLLDPHTRPVLLPKKGVLTSIGEGIAADRRHPARVPKGRGSAYPRADEARNQLRVRLDLAAIGRMRRPCHGELPPAMRETFGRWARALTRRRVGLALGGSGAWGYASAALMLKLATLGVPVDLVAGASSGALIGAYWCAAGRDGIARVVANGPTFGRAMPLMALTSAVVEYGVRADLGPARLEDLEVPLLPVATNLRELRPEVIVSGTIGFGVRASVSAPGLFASTVAGDAVYVDGAVSDNVPVALAEAMGADLVIATNPFPAATAIRSRPTGGMRAVLGPLWRVRDLMVSLDLMLHLTGARPGHGRTVFYHAGPAVAPLRTTFNYPAAQRIMDDVAADPRFGAAVDAAGAAWAELSQRRPARPAVRVAA